VVGIYKSQLIIFVDSLLVPESRLTERGGGGGGGGGGGVSWGGTPGPMTNKQVESCFLNHNSSIHFLY
jgi:hypothetical protein